MANYLLLLAITNLYLRSFFLGEIILIKALDRETTSSYQVTIEAVDGAPIPFELKSSHVITIQISDINDNVPRFEFTSPLTDDVLETASIGDSVLTLPASDADEGLNRELTFSIVSSNDTSGWFMLDARTGAFVVNSKLLRHVCK